MYANKKQFKYNLFNSYIDKKPIIINILNIINIENSKNAKLTYEN